MDIKDYLHLYFGAAVHSDKYIHPYPLTASNYNLVLDAGFKLILRPLSDMNEEECWNVLRLHHSYSVIPEPGKTDGRHYAYRLDYPSRISKVIYHHRPIEPKSPESTRWLLSKGFDLFGLIEAGLAIQKS